MLCHARVQRCPHSVSDGQMALPAEEPEGKNRRSKNDSYKSYQAKYVLKAPGDTVSRVFGTPTLSPGRHGTRGVERGTPTVVSYFGRFYYR